MPKIYARHAAGFLVELDDVPRDRLNEAIAWLIQHNYTPDPPSGDPWRRTPDGSPLCAKHNVVMTKREKQGDSWWSHRIIDPQTGEERFCKGYACPTSKADGFEL